MKTLKISSRGRRMQQFTKLHKGAGINLVSLMDIFTILVFFLLVSSSSVHQLPNNKALKLPTTVSEKAPKETLVITITRDAILVQGQPVAMIKDVLSDSAPFIATLEKELKFQSSKIVPRTDVPRKDQGEIAYPVTIMGDENVPYQLLRKILVTCRQAKYTRIAFSAFQKAALKAAR